ncbi:MAG TPA: Ig-like domain-containing protein, partial [Thermoanaerobaculia bacterium]|nr:Ig-like domain-containing protein [Thermoanaerobaculia bacterium]
IFVGFAGEQCFGVDPCTFTLFRDLTVRASFGLPDSLALRFTSPANGDTGVATSTQINATFNRDIVAGPDYGSLVLRESEGAPVPFTPVVRSTDRRLVLIPSSNFAAGRSYVVEIPAGAVSDTQGNPLATPSSFTFTTVVAGAPKMYIAAHPITVMEGNETRISLWFETPTAQERTILLTSTPAGELLHPSEVIVPAGQVLAELQVDTRRNSGSTSPVTATLSASEASAGQQSLPIVIANETTVTGNSLRFQAAGIISDEDGDGVLEAGETGEIRFDVANFGSSTIFNVRLDFSVLNTPYLRILGGAGGQYCELGALGAGRNGNCTKTVLADEELPTGDYYIEVRGVSSSNSILDQARIDVVNRFLPDFTLSARSITTAELQPGQTVNLTYTPRNIADGFSAALPLFEVMIEIEGTEHLLYRTYANARGYLWSDQDFRLPITVPPVPGVHPIRARINPSGTGRLTESNYSNNEATVLFLRVASPNQAPVLSPIPSPIAATAGKLLTFTVTGSDPNNDPITYRLGAGAPVGATLHSTSGVFTWTPSCEQGPTTFTFPVIASDNQGLEDTQSVAVQVGQAADLVLVQIQGSEQAVPGENVSYTVLATNQGPSCLTGATLSAILPPDLTGVQWTCTPTPGASCTATGSGSISDSSLNLPVNGSASYVVAAKISDFSQGVVTITTTVAPPASVTDPDGTNNSSLTSITLRGMDFGDAPQLGTAWRFPTLLLTDGARHGILPEMRLGATIDAEADGLASLGANGDDADLSRDEDGVVSPSPLAPCQTGTVQVTASAAGNLYVWIDFNTDGDWDDAGEWVVAQKPLIAGINMVSFPVPCGATPGGTAIGRFRFSSATGLAAHGLALDGEVEDHPLSIAQVFHRLSVTRAGTGTGTVTASPGGIECGADCFEDYPAGSVVTLTALPTPGSLFMGWSGAGCSGNSFCTVTLSNAQQVTATFAPYQNEIFNDGFESGTTSDWSETEPPY